MEFPKISILTPTYNRRKFLPLMIHNINSFDYDKNKIEWVICDDHPDNPLFTGDMLEKTKKEIYPVKLKYIYRPQKHLGIGEKRNLLVKNSTNKVLVNMDDDDIYIPNYIKYSIFTMKKNKVSIVGSNQMLFIYPYHNYKFTFIQCGAKRQAHEATMVYTKKHWASMGGYNKKGTGEGAGMVDFNEKNCAMTDIMQCMICVCHKDNTCSKDKFVDNDIHITTNGLEKHLEILKNIFELPNPPTN